MLSRGKRYPKLSIRELCEKLQADHRCTYKEIHTNFGAGIRTGAQLKAASGKSLPFFPDDFDVPLSDYEIEKLCRALGLDPDEVFPPQ